MVPILSFLISKMTTKIEGIKREDFTSTVHLLPYTEKKGKALRGCGNFLPAS